MWTALQGFMTITALVAKDHASSSHETLHKQLNRIALESAQRAGMRRTGSGGSTLRIVFYLLLRADGAASKDMASPARELRRYQWRGYKNGKEPLRSLIAEKSEHAKQLFGVALDGESDPLFHDGPGDDGTSVASLTVPVRHAELVWGVLRVESDDHNVFTATDSIYLTLIASGLAQSLTLLGDDAHALLNYSEGSDSAAERSDDGGSGDE